MKTKIWMAGALMASILSLSTLATTPQVFAGMAPSPTTTSFSINTSVLWNAQLDVPYSEQLQAGIVTMQLGLSGPVIPPAPPLLPFPPFPPFPPAPTALPLGPNTIRVHRAMAAPIVATSDKWVITQGNLPAGLSLSASGLVSGTPTGPAGTSSVTVQVTSANGQTATRTFSITVFGVHILQVATLSLPTGVAGKPYQSKLSAVGGQGPYMWKVAQGKLPTGVTLASDGTISGIPQQAGTYAFTVQTFDALGDSAAQYYQWTVSKSKN